MSHPTDGMDKVSTIEVVEPILVRVMGIGAMVKIMSRGVLHSILVTSVLERLSEHVEQ